MSDTPPFPLLLPIRVHKECIIAIREKATTLNHRAEGLSKQAYNSPAGQKLASAANELYAAAAQYQAMLDMYKAGQRLAAKLKAAKKKRGANDQT